MSKIILVTGGARSGKSRFAEGLALSEGTTRCYLATCPPPDGRDQEMLERVERHKQERAAHGWRTVEEALELAEVISRELTPEPLLVDCLTLWVSNLLFANSEINEDAMSNKTQALIAAARSRPGLTLFVTNEVGLGIVPENALARRFRDLVGRCNQTMAAQADEAYLVTCGIPLRLK